MRPLLLATLAAAPLAFAPGYASAAPTYSFINFDMPGAAGQTSASGINDAGQAVGIFYSVAIPQGFLRGTDGSYTTLSNPALADITYADGINDAGQVVGYFNDGNGNTQGFLRGTNGSYTTLSDPAATSGTYALSINNAGQVAGFYFDNTGNHGFIAMPDAPTAVPEPVSLVMLGMGLLGASLIGRLWIRSPAEPRSASGSQ